MNKILINIIILFFAINAYPNQTNHIQTIYLGSGCFWGAEKGYESIKGVIDAESGYANGYGVKPHGIEWKSMFKNILLPVLNDKIFPSEILKPLAVYTINPKASTDSDTELCRVLNQFNNVKKNYISELEINSKFFGTNGREYILNKKLRKRFQCTEITTKKIYLFNPNAEINRSYEKK